MPASPKRQGRFSQAVVVIVTFLSVFLKWICLTIAKSWRLENIRQVLVAVTALLQDAIARQADPTQSLLRSAYKAIVQNNLRTAKPLYEKAIRLNPMKSETYFLRASCLTYLDGNPSLVDQELALGVDIDKQIAEQKGLDVLNLKILGDDFAGMGHLSLLDPLVKLKRLGLITNNHLMVVSKRAVANVAYLNYWKKHLPVIVTNAVNYSAIRDLLSPLYENVSMLDGRSGHLPFYEAWNLALNGWGASPPILELDPADKEAGDRVLEKVGLAPGAWFAGLHVRGGRKGGHLRSGADADIQDYLPAIRLITERGGRVIRMGRGGEPLPAIANVWDYANSEHQSDWMDVYLWASCKFFIGTSSGPLSVPPTFGRPVLYTNACALGTSPNFTNSLMIPKLFWSDKRKSLLTFREILEGPYGWTVRPDYDEGHTQLVSNSPAEIVAAVDEMLNTLDRPELYATRTHNQEAFDLVRAPYRRTSQIRIADSFVKLHSDLLSPAVVSCHDQNS